MRKNAQNQAMNNYKDKNKNVERVSGVQSVTKKTNKKLLLIVFF